MKIAAFPPVPVPDLRDSLAGGAADPGAFLRFWASISDHAPTSAGAQGAGPDAAGAERLDPALTDAPPAPHPFGLSDAAVPGAMPVDRPGPDAIGLLQRAGLALSSGAPVPATVGAAGDGPGVLPLPQNSWPTAADAPLPVIMPAEGAPSARLPVPLAEAAQPEGPVGLAARPDDQAAVTPPLPTEGDQPAPVIRPDRLWVGAPGTLSGPETRPAAADSDGGMTPVVARPAPAESPAPAMVAPSTDAATRGGDRMDGLRPVPSPRLLASAPAGRGPAHPGLPVVSGAVPAPLPGTASGMLHAGPASVPVDPAAAPTQPPGRILRSVPAVSLPGEGMAPNRPSASPRPNPMDGAAAHAPIYDSESGSVPEVCIRIAMAHRAATPVPDSPAIPGKEANRPLPPAGGSTPPVSWSLVLARVAGVYHGPEAGGITAPPAPSLPQADAALSVTSAAATPKPQAMAGAAPNLADQNSMVPELPLSSSDADGRAGWTPHVDAARGSSPGGAGIPGQIVAALMATPPRPFVAPNDPPLSLSNAGSTETPPPDTETIQGSASGAGGTGGQTAALQAPITAPTGQIAALRDQPLPEAGAAPTDAASPGSPGLAAPATGASGHGPGPLPADGQARTEPPRADVPPPARQIADALRLEGGSRVELVLTPEELGRVTISFQGEGDSLRVHLAAERPETLDLLRRHAPDLAAELRAMGYDTAGFSFGGSRQSRPGPAVPVATPDDGDGGPAPCSSTAPVARHAPVGLSGTLDLRL